jgi:hypothetical protein
MASLRGDKSRFDLGCLGLSWDETGCGSIPVECVHEIFLMVELVLKRRHLGRSLVDEGQKLLKVPIRNGNRSRRRHWKDDNYI